MEQIVALYLRLSKADKRKCSSKTSPPADTLDMSASVSIKNQKSLLERYVRQDRELCCYENKLFIDDGFNGLEDTRPALQDMLSMAANGRVHAVVVKDFSRLSRNHLYLASLREQVFPSFKTELISLGDHYDSRKDDRDILALRFKSLFYEHYSRDISRKVKASLSAKKERGEYAVAKPPFGYRMEQGQWKQEEREAALVREIFRLAVEGYSNREICAILEKRALPAKLYPVKVMRILKNPAYCGKHVWHKYENYIGFHKKSIALPREQWRIEEGRHPAIISDDVFELVNPHFLRQTTE